MSVSNQPLAKNLRTQLENTVKAARDVAEAAAYGALNHLGVKESKLPGHLSDEQQALRRRLRAHGRSLGDAKHSDDRQELRHLVWEVSYEHWHRMLFARFLAENHLLLWEPGAPVTLAECEELAQDPSTSLGAKSGWELAGKLAARMLPQVFKPQNPVFELTFAPEHQRELEKLLAGLPGEVFQASDSLGWVYQFWQAKRKDEVNASEVKIGADELSAVTQLFTEPYMVDFLLHNSLGAWWVTRHPGTPCPVPLTYLRLLDDGIPAAGKFEGWPNRLTDFKLLDPCCGSGHFLVAAFLMLVPMRMEAEGLSAMDAVDGVLADNLHGLELDARCVEIAVFALALAAWRYPDENDNLLGVRADMPTPNVACCGLKVAAKPEDWMALVPDDMLDAAYLKQELRLLHASFAQAPLLGSLLDTARSLREDLATSSFDTLRNLLEHALANERPATPWGQTSELNDDCWDLALTARGLLDAARLLDARYHLVVTNVPYLGRGDQSEPLRVYIERHYPQAQGDLANVFVERALELVMSSGVVQVVMPRAWMFLPTYEEHRKRLLSEFEFLHIAVLGPRAFETISGHVVNVCLAGFRKCKPNVSTQFSGLDADTLKTAAEKAFLLRTGIVHRVLQEPQQKHPGSRISLERLSSTNLLGATARATEGLSTGDGEQFIHFHWEGTVDGQTWVLYQSAPTTNDMYSGFQLRLRWEQGCGALSRSTAARIQGHAAWNKQGVLIARVESMRAVPYTGRIFDKSCVALTAGSEETVRALRAFGSSASFKEQVRKLDKKTYVTTSVFTGIPFDVAEWRATDVVPPYSHDPTQWLFHGHPHPATDPLQVAVARLLGYGWPAEKDMAMELADEARTWIAHCEELADYADDDGIVCLSSVRGEQPAHDRLLALLVAAWESVQPGSWTTGKLDNLLADAECAGKGLDVWLREKFFEQHAKRFQHRPFIWHVWDGLKDGFGALVNYHLLNAKNLERLIHTYLGDWIRQQEAGVRSGVDGAQTRLAAALDLKRRLELILEGEAPYDIFVRWKSLTEQPIGWNPDLNDGVRMNIRPFMTAEVLRHNKKPKLNITWDKDRGKDAESAPWFPKFKGERINEHHLTLAEKRAAIHEKG